MFNFVIGTVFGIIVSTVGFASLAKVGTVVLSRSKKLQDKL